MAKQRSNRDAYTGRGGQMAAQAELLMRHLNVAVPEIDEGEDVFAFRTGIGEVVRIQVKTANASPLKEAGRYVGRVSVPLEQLLASSREELYYVFAIRRDESWADFVIISRQELILLYQDEGVGHPNQRAGELQLHLSFGPTTLTCGGVGLQAYRNAWQQLPLLRQPPLQAAPDVAGAADEGPPASAAPSSG